MPTFTAFQPVNLNELSYLFGAGADATITTSTHLRIVDGSRQVDVFGSGFGYDAQERFSAGTITRVEERDSGALVYRLDQAAYSAVTVQGFLDAGAGGAVGLRNFLFAGADVMVGSAGDDVLTGLGGNDVLSGGTGQDRLEGGSRNDVLNGGRGNDTLVGGSGHDTYIVNTAGDVVIESSTNARETDTVESGDHWTLGANLERLTLTGTLAVNGTGNELDNILTGNAAANTLIGGGGKDIISGGAGNDRLEGGSRNDVLNGGRGTDTMLGGSGHDIYVVNTPSDMIVESTNPDEIDTVVASLSWALGDNLEKLMLTGSLTINGTGNALNNEITGNASANVLIGGGGHDVLIGAAGNDRLEGGTRNDILNGGRGVDTMIGGSGHDTYNVDSPNDIVTEANDPAQIDTVISSVNYTLVSNVERLTLRGSASITGTGNQLSNVLLGNSGNNLLKGSGGDDSVNGGAGNDVVDGGAGNDDLTGGAGVDSFLFASALNGTTNVDTVVDFVSADDRFDLDNAIFQNSGVTFGALGAESFRAGTVAGDASDRVIYDQGTGNLFYDTDGTGSAGQILFARVDAGTSINVSDFFIA